MCCRSLLFSSKLSRTAWLRAKSRLAKPSGANSARRPGQCNSTQTWHKRKKAPCSRCNAPAKTSQKAQRKASPILLQNPTVGSLCFPKLSTAISECVEESRALELGSNENKILSRSQTIFFPDKYAADRSSGVCLSKAKLDTSARLMRASGTDILYSSAYPARADGPPLPFGCQIHYQVRITELIYWWNKQKL